MSSLNELINLLMYWPKHSLRTLLLLEAKHRKWDTGKLITVRIEAKGVISCWQSSRLKYSYFLIFIYIFVLWVNWACCFLLPYIQLPNQSILRWEVGIFKGQLVFACICIKVAVSTEVVNYICIMIWCLIYWQ